LRRLEPGEKALGERDGPLDVRLRHERDELVPAEARWQVARAQRHAQGRPDVLQHRVARGVAEVVVDLLEPVDVDHRAGEGVIVAAVPHPFPLGVVEKRAAVHHARERVDHRQLAQPARQRGELRNRLLVAPAQRLDLVDQFVRNGRLAPHPADIGPLEAEEAIGRRHEPLAPAVNQLQRQRAGGLTVERQRLPEPRLRWLVERREEVASGCHQRNSGAQPRARLHHF